MLQNIPTTRLIAAALFGNEYSFEYIVGVIVWNKT